MKHILFVDDDVSLLDGLRVRLRPMQDKWMVAFAENGPQALAELQQNHYDVIVSDIRMPGMHGVRLLRVVCERWPQTARIALSGFVDHGVSHLVPFAHQFLSKPCKPEQLENVIERCLSMQDLLPDRALQALVGRVQRLSPNRRTFLKLQALLASKTASVREVAQLVASDTVVAAKVLHTVSSSFHHLDRRTTDIEVAVGGLGLTSVRELIMSAEVFAQWPPKAASAALDLESLQVHVDAIAKVGQALTVDTPIANDTLLAARLHDIGYWILVQECPHELVNAVALARASDFPLYEAERQVIGASHAEIGAYLLGLWGLPPSVVEAVAEHHTPERARRFEFDPSAALAVAIAVSGGDDADAFRDISRSTSSIGPEYLESVRAPFDWSEALRRAAASLG